MKVIDIIVPCYNEEDVLKQFYVDVNKVISTLGRYEFNLIFVDDGSKDKTLFIMKELAEHDEKVKYFSFTRNFGKEAAMFAGLEASKGDYVVIMDADLQDDPVLLTEMILALESGYDCCVTRRVNRKGEPFIRSFFARKFYKIMNGFSDVELVDGERDYRMMKRQMVDAILLLKEKERFSKGIFNWVGFKTKWIEYVNVSRAAGETKWSFWKLVRYAVKGITAFSTVPLRAVMFMGVFISFAAIVFMIVKIIKTMIYGVDVPGYASIVVLVTFLGGINLFAIGLIGDYLGRVYSEVKGQAYLYCEGEWRKRGII